MHVDRRRGEMIDESRPRGKAPETRRTGVCVGLLMRDEGLCGGERGFTRDAPCVVGFVVRAEGGEGAEAGVGAGEAGDGHGGPRLTSAVGSEGLIRGRSMGIVEFRGVLRMR